MIVGVRFGALVPAPPGTKSTSSSGAVAKVCVGTMVSKKEEFPRVGIVNLVETGLSVSAMRERDRVWFMARILRASRGPVTSRSSKAGKRM